MGARATLVRCTTVFSQETGSVLIIRVTLVLPHPRKKTARALAAQRAEFREETPVTRQNRENSLFCP